MTTTLRRGLTALCTFVIMLVCAVVAAAAPATTTSTATLTNIRTGVNTGFDRVVLDLSGPAPSTTFQQVSDLYADPSGELVWLTGAQFVSVTATPATAAGYTGSQKFRTRNLTNVMAVAITGDFEGYLSVGLGTRTPPSFVRVFTLTAPTRVVIDIGN